MPDIVTDISINQNWNARKGANNPVTFTFTQNAAAFDISTYTFSVQLRKFGSSTNILNLTQGSGITNNGAAGTLNVVFTSANLTNLVANDYYWQMTVVHPDTFSYLWYQGTFNLYSETYTGDLTSTVTGTIDLNVTTINTAITLGGSGSSMTYPGAGIALSTGSAWDTSITNNSSNWNTAFGWGNHASAGYLTGLTNGNGTTANGSAVDLGGTQSGNISIIDPTGTYNFYVGGGMSNNPDGIQFVAAGQAYIGRVSTGLRFASGGTTLTIGSDASQDLYKRDPSGYLVRIPLGSSGDVLTNVSGTVGWAAPSGGGWALTGTSTLTGAVDIVGSSSNTIKHTFNSLGTTQTDGAGLHFRNTTAAAAGAQQISPSIVLEGQGWKTNATAASQSVKYVMDVLPVQGAANPTATFRLGYSINGAAYTYPVTFDQSNSYFSVPNIVATSGTIQLNSSRILLFNGGLGSIRSDANAGLEFRANSSSTVISGGQYRFYNINNYTATSGTQTIIANETGFAPTSGTAVFNAYLGSGTINQTGGANGVVSMLKLTPTYTAVGGDVNGIYYNPTVTSVTGVHYSFRSTSGNFLMGSTGKSANTGENVIVLNNATTNATAAQTNGIVIHSKDSSDGSANATLSLYTEQAPEATATFTQTHRIKVWWNNAEYWLSLDAV